MIEKSVYVAYDGKEFESADACLAYEKELEMKDAGQWHEINMVFVFNDYPSVHRTRGSEEDYAILFKSSPQYLYFANDEDAEEFQEIVNRMGDSDINFNEAGLWRYSYFGGWELADDVRERCRAQISGCNREINELDEAENTCENLIEWEG